MNKKNTYVEKDEVWCQALDCQNIVLNSKEQIGSAEMRTNHYQNDAKIKLTWKIQNWNCVALR